MAAVCAALLGNLVEDSGAGGDDTADESSFASVGLGAGVLASCTAMRESCCLEDAVFSRTPNWVERDFIFARRPSQERLL